MGLRGSPWEAVEAQNPDRILKQVTSLKGLIGKGESRWEKHGAASRKARDESTKQGWVEETVLCLEMVAAGAFHRYLQPWAGAMMTGWRTLGFSTSSKVCLESPPP